MRSRIRYLRTTNRPKLSQFELAKAANCDPSTIARLERGEQAGRADTLSRIATVLGVPLGDLFEQESA